MKHIERVRAEVVSHTERFLEHLRVRWSLYFGDDPELLDGIDRSHHPDLTVLLTNTLMTALGDGRPGTKEPRFDRTRRLVNRKHKGPRGVSKRELHAGEPDA